MKSSAITFIGIILFFFAVSSYGFNKSSLSNMETREAAITNLLIGIQSENFGLRTGSAFMLGELRADGAVIPLMKMLRNEKNEDARIVAALALYKINDSRGVFAVKQAIKFDDSERVRKMCTNFYNQTLRDRYGIADQSNSENEVALK